MHLLARLLYWLKKFGEHYDKIADYLMRIIIISRILPHFERQCKRK